MGWRPTNHRPPDVKCGICKESYETRRAVRSTSDTICHKSLLFLLAPKVMAFTEIPVNIRLQYASALHYSSF